MSEIDLYVNSTDMGGAWTRVGTQPYLDTQNQPTSTIHSASRNADSDVFGFTDSSDLGTISKVELYIYAVDGGSSSDFEAYINSSATGLNPPSSWGWVSVDITAIVGTTWDGVNAATVYFDKPNTTNDPYVDAAYLKVTYSAGNPAINYYDNATASDASEQYITPYLTNVNDNNPTVTDVSEQYISPYLNLAYDSPTITDEITVAVTLLINIYDSISLQDENDVSEITPVNINQNDDLSLSDEINQYITPYEVYVSDDIGLDDSGISSISGITISLKTDLWQITFQTTALIINVYDALDLTDSISDQLTFYQIYATDDISTEDISSMIVPYFNLYVNDEISVTDNISQYVTPYLIQTSDDLNVSDEMNSLIPFINIQIYDTITVTDYEDVTIPGLLAQINVFETISLTEYANVARAIYPFLQGYLTILLTRSNLSVIEQQSELDVTFNKSELYNIDNQSNLGVSDTDSNLSITR